MIIYEKKNNLSFVLNIRFDLFILLKDLFKFGDYIYIIKLKNYEGSWMFLKDFMINKK